MVAWAILDVRVEFPKLPYPDVAQAAGVEEEASNNRVLLAAMEEVLA